MKNNQFHKKTYASFRQFFSDLVWPIQKSKELKALQKSEMISPAFRERLMLAVTGVNKCRYCSYFHTREAMKSGLSKEEIRKLLTSEFTDCPPEEATAIAYAQHWAESDSHPSIEAVNRLIETYGVEKSEAIHIVLRMIRIGNLTGNSWDAFLHKLSFGRWGN